MLMLPGDCASNRPESFEPRLETHYCDPSGPLPVIPSEVEESVSAITIFVMSQILRQLGERLI
jgi:hypothetical protein